MIETRLNRANLNSVRLPGGVAEGTGVRGTGDLFSPGEQTEPGLIKPDFGLMKPSRAPLPTWPIPAANAQGDYQVRTYFDQWQVTDPTGLNVRVPAGFPEHPDSRREDWPVRPDMGREDTKLGSFPPGASLKPVMGEMGIQYLQDAQGAPWMMVTGEGETGQPLTGFVRSNMRHIQPERPNGPIPLADSKGDFRSRSQYDKWQVSDATDLNVRIPKGFPEHPDSRMEDWPVLPDMSQEDSKLGSFPPGTNLTPVMGSRGIQYLYDVNRSPWMMVEGRGADGNTLSGFVRSNAKHIRPRQD